MKSSMTSNIFLNDSIAANVNGTSLISCDVSMIIFLLQSVNAKTVQKGLDLFRKSVNNAKK